MARPIVPVFVALLVALIGSAMAARLSSVSELSMSLGGAAKRADKSGPHDQSVILMNMDDPEAEDIDVARVMDLAARSGQWSRFTHPLLGLVEDDESFCHDRAYRKRTLKLIKEMPFVGLFHDLQTQRRFEGSGMVTVGDYYYIIFDSLRSIGRVGTHLNYRGDDNILVNDGEETDSQFEGITYCPKQDTFVTVRESWVPADNANALVPLTEEVAILKGGEDYKKLRMCPIAFQLEDENKGFESIHYYDGEDGERYLLGMCESNFCKTIVGPDAPGLQNGNGRLVLGRLRTKTRLRLVEEQGMSAGPLEVERSSNPSDCVWEYVKTIVIPESAHFMDYAGIAFKGEKGRQVAIVSQEDAAVWVGKFDWDAMEFVEGRGKVYHLPRDNQCNKIFCNVEGINWIDDERLALASDAAKTATQPWWCATKDQTMHVFGLP